MSLVSADGCSELTTVPGGWGTRDSRDRPRFDTTGPARGVFDETSRSWVKQLQVGHPRHRETVAGLHLMMGKMAARELARRHSQLPALTGPEFDDLAQQAADDALIKVLNRLDSFRGLSRFTTWVYRFVICEVSTKVAAHAWRRQPPSLTEQVWEELSAPSRWGPEETLERRAQLHALREAIGQLTERQRRVFVSIALNEVPIDIVALEFGTNRNAIYKNLFDARQSLRARMAAAGHPVSQREPCGRDEPRGALGTRC
jgi:RNA polymerase sigma-70 factor (ECF subfamily)